MKKFNGCFEIRVVIYQMLDVLNIETLNNEELKKMQDKTNAQLKGHLKELLEHEQASDGLIKILRGMRRDMK